MATVRPSGQPLAAFAGCPLDAESAPAVVPHGQRRLEYEFFEAAPAVHHRHDGVSAESARGGGDVPQDVGVAVEAVVRTLLAALRPHPSRKTRTQQVRDPCSLVSIS